MRNNGRENDELRKIDFHLNYTKNAEASVLAIFGDTKVLCNVTIESG
ncbi:MAG: ribonuclease PH, partial [Pseudomonadota bacterium]|nr:ribonuclease PH [Pseudomonadota bacterium]